MNTENVTNVVYTKQPCSLSKYAGSKYYGSKALAIKGPDYSNI